MGDKSGIQWTDATWNPIAGCSIVSKGCTNCYAMRVAHRLGANPKTAAKYGGLTKVVNGNPVWTGEIHVDEAVMDQPFRWQRPRRIFVNSMSDLFHEGVRVATIDQVFAVMRDSPHHIFQILTKRPDRMREYLHSGESVIAPTFSKAPFRNVWLGVSIEDQASADARIPVLLDTPSVVRWVSYEPALGPVDLHEYTLGFSAGYPAICAACGHGHGFTRCPNYGRVSRGCHEPGCYCPGFRHKTGTGIDWIVAGGESGPGARPMHPSWMNKTRDQCRRAGVPFFFKQWGDWRPFEYDDYFQGRSDRARWADACDDGSIERNPAGATHIRGKNSACRMYRVGKKAAGRLLDGRTWDQYPEVSS